MLKKLERAAALSSGNHVGSDDKPLGCMSHKIEWVAGHEGQNIVAGIVEHVGVVGRYNPGRIHLVSVGRSQRRQSDFIVLCRPIWPDTR